MIVSVFQTCITSALCVNNKIKSFQKCFSFNFDNTILEYLRLTSNPRLKLTNMIRPELYIYVFWAFLTFLYLCLFVQHVCHIMVSSHYENISI